MTDQGTHSVAATDAQGIRDLMAEIDRMSASAEDQWANKRRSERRQARVPCMIRHLDVDGQTILATDGHIRDLSTHGLGFVARGHFVRSAPVCVIVILGEGKRRKLTGRVVYSKFVREDWHLTGVKFGPLNCIPLELHNSDQESTPDRSQRTVTKGSPSDSQQSGTRTEGTSQWALRTLAFAAASKRASREMINKVTLLSASDDHVVRNAAVPALMQIGGPEGKMGLARLLQDPNSQVQIEAAEALGQLNAQSEIEPLKELLKHKNPDVALRVAAVLGRLGDRSGIAIVRQYIRTDNPHTRDGVRTLGIILGCKFRLNDQGISEARRCLKKL